MIRRRPTRSFVLASALVATLAGGSILTACGSDDPKESTATTAAGAEEEEEGEEYEIVSDAAVATGLASTITTLTSMSAAPATATAEAITEVFEEWESYEGTIKENDANSYLTFEDALGAFKKAAEAGDQGAMTAATADFSTAASTYLTAHPGA